MQYRHRKRATILALQMDNLITRHSGMLLAGIQKGVSFRNFQLSICTNDEMDCLFVLYLTGILCIV